MTSRAPSWRYDSTSFVCTLAVMKTAGVEAVAARARSARSAAGPSICGIMTSSRSSWGPKSAAAATASAPEPHALTVRPPTSR